MRVHCLRGRRAIAPQNGLYDAVVLEMGFRETSEISKLCSAERLHAATGRECHLNEIAVVRAGIDGGMKHFIHFVISLRVTALNQTPQLLVNGLEFAALETCHPFGGKICA